MKKYKLLNDGRYGKPCNFNKGVILDENELMISGRETYSKVSYYVEKYPEDWEEVIEFNVKEYLINILNDEELYVELENVEELKKLFEIINRLRFSLNKKLETKENKIKATINHGKQVRFNLSKNIMVNTENPNVFMKFSEIIEHIKQQVNK